MIFIKIHIQQVDRFAYLSIFPFFYNVYIKPNKGTRIMIAELVLLYCLNLCYLYLFFYFSYALWEPKKSLIASSDMTKYVKFRLRQYVFFNFVDQFILQGTIKKFSFQVAAATYKQISASPKRVYKHR